MSQARKPLAISVWETSDHKRHNTEQAANEWEQWITDLCHANEMFANGATLLASLVRANQSRPWVDLYRGPEQAVILERIRSDTKLRISHWQCHEQPVYLVESLLDDGTLRVGGVGGWSGYYANRVPVSDLIRYATETFKRFPGEEPA